MSHLIEFETERLRLRQWRLSDREPFAALNADLNVMAFFPSMLDKVASDAMADRCESLMTERGWGFWAVETKEDSQFIGFTGLHVPIAELPFSPCVEVGWRLAFQYWARGYATEAARGALGAAFDLLNLREVVSFTTVKNVRSRAVMEKLGMREEAVTFEHPSVSLESGFRTHCLYRLTREQWLENTT